MSGPSANNTSRALELLREGVTKLMTSDAWRRALALKAAFRHYSFHNGVLIALQCPGATLVAGYRAWRRLGRHVRRGERGIAILAPVLRKRLDELTGEEHEQLVGFRTVFVFDVSQTEGAPLPEPPRPTLLTDDTRAIRALTRRVEALARSRGIAVERAPLAHAYGRYLLDARRITLHPSLPPLQELKTLIHELAHALAHGDGRHTSHDVPRLELEAESTAFIVCHALELDTSDYSFPYLAGWAESPEDLLAIGEVAARTAELILAALGSTPSGRAVGEVAGDGVPARPSNPDHTQ